MKKVCKYGGLMFLILLSLQISAQGFKYLTVQERGKELISIKKSIVDIDSRLDVTIDTKKLYEDLAPVKAVANIRDVERQKRFNKMLELQKKAIEALDNGAQVELGSVTATLLLFHGALEKLDPELYKRFSEVYTRATNTPRLNNVTWKYALVHFLDGYEFITHQQEGVSKTISLQAFLKSNNSKKIPVHVTNYDNIQEKGVWRVGDWVDKPTKEQIDLATETIEGILGNFKSLGVLLDKEIERLDILGEADNLKELVQELEVKQLPSIVDKTQSILGDVLQIKNLQSEKFTATTSYELEQLSAKVSKEVAQTKLLSKASEKLNGKSLAQVDKILDKVLNKVIELADVNEKAFQPHISALEKGKKAAEQILYHTIEEAPKVAFIDLKTAGKRDNYDELQIELIIADTNKTIKPQTIEMVTIRLVKVKPYAKINLGAILANPIAPNEKVALERAFQFAPSASFMIKWGSRTSGFVNFLEPGLGINLSTPDFDLNAIPEFSFGLTGSILRDAIQIGISYNTGIDVPFYFIGFSLPITGLAIPLSNTTTSLNN